MTAERILKNKGGAVATIAPTATVGDAVNLLASNNIGAVVVSSDGLKVEGILSERDVVRAMGGLQADIFDAAVSDLMTANVLTCSRGDGTRRMLATMTERRIRHLPVVEDGKLVGLVSIGDVVKIRLDDLATETEAMQDYIKG
jgi:CBS domain-containing protein